MANEQNNAMKDKFINLLNRLFSSTSQRRTLACIVSS